MRKNERMLAIRRMSDEEFKQLRRKQVRKDYLKQDIAKGILAIAVAVTIVSGAKYGIKTVSANNIQQSQALADECTDMVDLIRQEYTVVSSYTIDDTVYYTVDIDGQLHDYGVINGNEYATSVTLSFYQNESQSPELWQVCGSR